LINQSSVFYCFCPSELFLDLLVEAYIDFELDLRLFVVDVAAVDILQFVHELLLILRFEYFDVFMCVVGGGLVQIRSDQQVCS